MKLRFPQYAAMRRVLACVLFALLTLPVAVRAQSNPPDDQQPARVTFMNREIAELRVPFLTATPTLRASDAERRIARGAYGPGRVSLQRIPEGAAVKVDGALVFVITPGDADSLGGESLEAVANRAGRALDQALGEWRESRDSQRLLRAAGLSALATLIFVGLLFGLWRSDRWLANKLGLKARGVERLKIAGVKLLPGESLEKLVRAVLALVSWLVTLALTYWWISGVFRRFPLTRAWGERLRELLTDSATKLLAKVVAAIPNLLVAVLIFFVARFLNRTLDAFFNAIERRRVNLGWLDRDTIPPTRRIAGMVVWLFAVAMAYPYLPGANTDAFKGVSVLFAVMVSLGASNVFGQAASGLVLMYTRAFRAGEFVRIGESEGKLVELGLFATRLRSPTGVETTIPNAVVLASVTNNNSRAASSGAFVLETGVTIGYDAPWRLVRTMLLEAARRTESVLPDPPPRVYQAVLDNFYVNYRLVCQVRLTGDRLSLEVRDDLHANIQDQFNEHEIQIMTPAYEGDPDQAKVVPKSRWGELPAKRS
jgi:small-conductance mechanosensitive channel